MRQQREARVHSEGKRPRQQQKWVLCFPISYLRIRVFNRTVVLPYYTVLLLE